MSGFISLTCPACGAKLNNSDDEDRFICEYCNNEQLIDRAVQTTSKAPDDVKSAQEPEAVSESPAELAMSRLAQEVSELEDALEEIGIPSSIGEIVTSSTGSIIFNLLFAFALFFGAWAAGEVALIEGIQLLLMQFTFGVIGIRILVSAIGAIRNGVERISNSRSGTEKRILTIDRMANVLGELDKRQAAEFNAQAQNSSLELASEGEIRRLKYEIAEFQEKITYLETPESTSSIILSTVFWVIIIAMISNWLLSWASSQTLPTFIEAQLPGEGPLPSTVWWMLGISGIIFALGPLKTIEEGIHKLNRRRFYIEERKRLEKLLASKLEKLEGHQNTLSKLLT